MNKIVSRVLLVSSFLFAGRLQATPVEYNKISDMDGKVANIVCSGFSQNGQIHVLVSLDKNKVSDFIVFGVDPASKAHFIETDKIKSSRVEFEASKVKIEATGQGFYFDPILSLVIVEAGNNKNWNASVSFDDNDGIWFQREMNCGATNYKFMPK